MARCYEDFVVGEVVEAGPVGVTADAIKPFAEKFEPQPPNDNAPDAAVAGQVASGLHITCLNMRLLVDAFPVRYAGNGKPRCGEICYFTGSCWRESNHATRSRRPAAISRASRHWPPQMQERGAQHVWNAGDAVDHDLDVRKAGCRRRPRESEASSRTFNCPPPSDIEGALKADARGNPRLLGAREIIGGQPFPQRVCGR
jgi:hypothetical protein